jgi:hypothetical protein
MKTTEDESVDFRICINDCISIAIPYSCFCIKHADLSEFTSAERDKQNDFLFQHQNENIGINRRKLKKLISIGNKQ